MRLKLYHQASGETIAAALRAGSVIQMRAAAGGRPVYRELPYFHWQTCLRSLALVPEDFPEWSGGEWLDDRAAYERILEIACGLHSPLVGETEVFGQFKEAFQNCIDRFSRQGASSEQVAFAATLRHWHKALIEDVKLVRETHLRDLGSQSYGSLVRREVREFREPKIEFLGSGQLVSEILPWLLKVLKPGVDDGRVTLHARNAEKAQASFMARSEDSHEGGRTVASLVDFRSLHEGPEELSTSGRSGAVPCTARVLIVAAPMTSREIAAWAKDRVRYDLILDLRGESRHDGLEPICLSSRLRSLDEIFSSIETAKEAAVIRKNEACKMIHERVSMREASATHRPFGWDDVWS
ncbi:MAG: hypothetical protein RBT63_03775 [Bdellovibrionales bacterium]|nr:hypothetical protein [Bdellovibrionales bacterium]